MLRTLTSSSPAQVWRSWGSTNRFCPTPTPKDPNGVLTRVNDNHRLATVKVGVFRASSTMAKKKIGAGHNRFLVTPIFLFASGHMEEVKDKGGRPGLCRCDRNCFCVFPCLSEIMSPSSAVLIELAVFVIAGG